MRTIDPDSPVRHRPILGGRNAPLSWWALLFLGCTPLIAHAEGSSQSATGIPIEWLFAVIAGLVGVIYLDLKREVRDLHREGDKRSEAVSRLSQRVTTIQTKLNINIHDRFEEDNE